jgi:DNA-binding phage protein
MLSFLQNIDPRRASYLNLVSSVEAQLRDIYARLHDAGLENQASLAKKLGVSRSVVNRRLTGQQNMTLETVADMVWALGATISVKIDDPLSKSTANFKLPDLSSFVQSGRIDAAAPIETKRVPTGQILSPTPVVEWRKVVV